MVRVALWGSLRSHVDGKSEIEVEAKDIRELFKEIGSRYPGLEPQLARGIAVSIDGVIYRDSWMQPLPEDAEIVLLPRIAGG